MDHKLTYYLQIADNALILSHRLSEYCSNGPFLEEDLANTNVALDLIGLAESTLEEAAKIEGLGRSGDDLAYRRPEHEFYNTLLMEQPNKDFAFIMVRQFFSDAFNFSFFSDLSKSKDPFLAALAVKTLKESTYHLRRSSEWMVRLGDGTPEAKKRTQFAINSLWKFTGDFFAPSEADKFMIANGSGIDLEKLQKTWRQKVKEIFFMAQLECPGEENFILGGKQGRHSEYLGHILTEIQYLPTKYPDASW
jgi:ring-1,2-phenylacetyl-CoA epoxidase subunit PaaC